MKHLTKTIGSLLLLLYVLPQTAKAAETLIPVGQVVGLELNENRVTIAAFDDTLGQAAREAGLRVGDELLQVGDRAVHTARDVQTALQQSKGLVDIEICRSGKKMTLRVVPTITADGPKLGLYLRQGVTGIGTVTWYDPESGQFAALGHGVNNGAGELVTMTGGNAYAARVQSVKPGRVGQPGQLLGAVTDSTPVGTITRNTSRGIFGACSPWAGDALPVAEEDEVCTGAATIRSTVSGNTPRDYSVEILKIYPEDRQDGRNLLIKVTDPSLLEITGGIVQGMSGSPIIQNGKLIGAVTHVLVNDPTTGYGIFIENMLDAAA